MSKTKLRPTKANGMTFENWMRRVDGTLNGSLGIDSGDLIDVDWRDEYDSDRTPREAISELAEALEIKEVW